MYRVSSRIGLNLLWCMPPMPIAHAYQRQIKPHTNWIRRWALTLYRVSTHVKKVWYVRPPQLRKMATAFDYMCAL